MNRRSARRYQGKAKGERGIGLESGNATENEFVEEEQTSSAEGSPKETSDRSMASMEKFVWSTTVLPESKQEKVTMEKAEISGAVVASSTPIKRGKSRSFERNNSGQGTSVARSDSCQAFVEGQDANPLNSSVATIQNSSLPNFSNLHSPLKRNARKETSVSVGIDCAHQGNPKPKSWQESRRGGYKEIQLQSDSSNSSSDETFTRLESETKIPYTNQHISPSPSPSYTASLLSQLKPFPEDASLESRKRSSRLSAGNIRTVDAAAAAVFATPRASKPTNRAGRLQQTRSRPLSMPVPSNQSLLVEYLKSLGKDQAEIAALMETFVRPNKKIHQSNTAPSVPSDNSNVQSQPDIPTPISNQKLLIEYLVKLEGKHRHHAESLVASFVDKRKDYHMQPSLNASHTLTPSEQGTQHQDPHSHTPHNTPIPPKRKIGDETSKNDGNIDRSLSREEWIIKEKIAAMRIFGPPEPLTTQRSTSASIPENQMGQTSPAANHSSETTTIKDQIRAQMAAHIASTASSPSRSPAPIVSSPDGRDGIGNNRRIPIPRAIVPGAEQLTFRAPGFAPSWADATQEETIDVSAPQQPSDSEVVPQESTEAQLAANTTTADIDIEDVSQRIAATTEGDDHVQEEAIAVVVSNTHEHILEATPVGQNDDADVTYVEAVAMPSTIKLVLGDRKVRWCLVFSLIISMVLAASVGTILGNGTRALDDDDDNIDNNRPSMNNDISRENSYSPTVAPTSSPAPTIDLSDLFDVLVEISDPQDLNTIGSPQHSAMIWLGNEDTTGIKFSDRMFSQRYATVVLFFAMRTKQAEKTLSYRQWESNWLIHDKHECDWSDVIECDVFAGNRYVRVLDLSKSGLDGIIPPEIGLFQRLVALDIHENTLRGQIPEQITNLVSLTTLNLEQNQISGPLPSTIGKMSSLSSLNLCNNFITGRLVDGIWEMRGLRTLRMCFNDFSGTISENIVKLEPLTILDLVSNHFSGTIPSNSFSNLVDLAFIHLDHNILSGSLPSNGTFEKRRVETTFADNLFTGVLPNTPSNPAMDIGFRIQKFDASFNMINGTISPGLGYLKTLKHIDVSSNRLTGTIPNTFGPYGLLSDLEHLNLGGNALNGTIPKLGRPERTRFLSLKNNQLTGGLPIYFGELEVMEFLEVGGNPLGGSLPTELGLLTNLRHFSAFNASVGGTLSAELTTLSNLGVLYLGSNMISKKIPVSIGNMRSLRELDLAFNLLTGKLPKTMGNMDSLEILKLNNNSLRGPIPDEFALLRELREIYLQENRLSGLVPETVCRLHDRDLEIIRVDCIIACGCCSESIDNPCP